MKCLRGAFLFCGGNSHGGKEAAIFTNARTSRARQVQQTSMQAALDAERDVLLQAAWRNASRYSEAEDATKDFVIE